MAVFHFDAPQAVGRRALYLNHAAYASVSRFFEKIGPNTMTVNIVLFKPARVTLRYAYQKNEGFGLVGDGVVKGTVTLYPKEGGSYRPPARAFLSSRAKTTPQF